MANIPVVPPDLQGVAGTLDVPATYVQALTPVAIAPPDLQGLAGTVGAPATTTHDMKGYWPSNAAALTVAAAYFGIPKRWSGAAWAKCKVQSYSGGWQTKKLMRWDGATWREVDNTG